MLSIDEVVEKYFREKNVPTWDAANRRIECVLLTESEFRTALEAVVPQDYVVVPLEPTEEMLNAGAFNIPVDADVSSRGVWLSAAKDIYQAMLAGAPPKETKDR